MGQDIGADGNADEVGLGDRPRHCVRIPPGVQGAQVSNPEVLYRSIGDKPQGVLAARVQGVHQAGVGVHERRLIAALEQELAEEAAPDLTGPELHSLTSGLTHGGLP